MIARTSHLCEHLIQPLKRPMKVNLDPARGGCDILSVILCTPTLYKAHPDRTHFGQLVHCLESMVDRLSKKSGKLLVIENLEAAAGRNLTHRGGMESMVVVTVSRLHEYSRITEALCIDLASHIIQVNTLSNVAPRVLDSRVAVHIRQLTQAEPVVVLVAWVCEPVDDDRVVVGVVNLPNSAVQLIIGDGRPVEGFLIRNRLCTVVVRLHPIVALWRRSVCVDVPG